MDRQEVRDAIASELTEILDVDGMALADATTAPEVAGWDSLVQLKLFVALERRLKIKFSLSDMSHPNTVGELVDLILAKRGG